MPIKVNVKGFGNVEFPDGTPKEDIRRELLSLTEQGKFKQDGVFEKLFPRASSVPQTFESREEGLIGKTEPKTVARQALGVAADVASLPGRAALAAPALVPGGETFGEALARTRSKPETKGVLGFAEDVARSPAAGVAGLGSKLAGPLISRVPGGAGLFGKVLTGAAEAIPEAAIEQAGRFGETGEFSPVEAGLEVATGAALPVLGGIFKSFGSKLFQSAIKPTTAMKRQLSDQIGNVIQKHDIGGTFEDVVNKAQNKIDNSLKNVDSIIEAAAKNNPNAKINIDDVVLKFVDDLDQGKLDIFFGDEEKAANVAFELLNALEKRKIVGEVTLDAANKAKRLLGKRAFKKGAIPTAEDALKDRVREVLNLNFRDEIQKIVPEIAEENRIMRELIPVKKAAEAAIERSGNRNQIFNFRNMMGALGVGQVTGEPLTAIAGGIVADQLLGRGRGAAIASGLGTLLQTPSTTQPTISRIIDPRRRKEQEEFEQRVSAPFQRSRL